MVGTLCLVKDNLGVTKDEETKLLKSPWLLDAAWHPILGGFQIFRATKNKMQPTNPNAHTYVNGTDVETHGYAVTQNTFLQ